MEKKKSMKRIINNVVVIMVLGTILSVSSAWAVDYSTIQKNVSSADRSAEWYSPDWLTNSPFSPEFEVLDTESALGRYSPMTKTITLKDLVKFHGHACDGLVQAAIELRLAFDELFPEELVDRTDLRVMTKNGPCFVDTVAYLTGGRINYGTLEIDKTLGASCIVERISTGKAVKITRRKGVFPKELAAIEKKIKAGNATPAEITKCRDMAFDFSRAILSHPSKKSFTMKVLSDFNFPESVYPYLGIKGDITQKDHS